MVIAEIRRCAAYIGQEPVLGAETVRDALLLPFQFKAHRASKPPEPKLVEALRLLHLPEAILNQDCSRVSGGEKQRIALARGLLLGKSLYLLDEVTSALDTESKQAVFDVFADPRSLSGFPSVNRIKWCHPSRGYLHEQPVHSH